MTFTRRRLGGSWGWISGSLLLLIALMVIVYQEFPWSLIMAAPAIVLGVILSLVTEKVEVDLDTWRYRSYFSILGSRAGRYRPLPELKAILLRDFNAIERDPDGERRKSEITELELALLGLHGGKLVLMRTENERQARSLAHELARRTGLPVQDRSRS